MADHGFYVSDALILTGFRVRRTIGPGKTGFSRAVRPLAADINPLMGDSMRYQSRLQLFGLPILSVAVGPDLASNQARGVARGIIAIGDVAVGGLAFGGVAFGIVPIGGMSFGIVAIGGVTVGIIALGGAAVGGIALGGLAIGINAVGGLAVGVYSHGGLAIGLYPEGGMVIRLFGR